MPPGERNGEGARRGERQAVTKERERRQREKREKREKGMEKTMKQVISTTAYI